MPFSLDELLALIEKLRAARLRLTALTQPPPFTIPPFAIKPKKRKPMQTLPAFSAPNKRVRGPIDTAARGPIDTAVRGPVDTAARGDPLIV